MSGLTTIYLVRHGETDWNASGRCQGTADVAMNAVGWAQIRRLARELSTVAFDAAYTSPLQRARVTAAEILGPQRVRAATVSELSEISYGILQGSRQSDWDDDLERRWTTDPWSVHFPEGESLAMVHARAIPVLDRIIAAHPGETVLISGHGHLNRVLILHAQHRSPDSFWQIEQTNGSATMLQLSSTTDLA